MYKRDINLLPKRKQISASLLLSVFLVLIFIGLLLFAGIMIPREILAGKTRKLDSLKKQIEEYDNVQIDFLLKSAEYDKLLETKNTLEDFTEYPYKVHDQLKLILENTPKGLEFTQYHFAENMISLEGVQTDDLLIADFELSLRKTEIFKEIHLEYIKGGDNDRGFLLAIYFYSSDELAVKKEEQDG